ncbi:hypothetical protein [Cyclobacterium xiamenense]|uniref:hypothetical protein n=1 Tax=Cyclobacterium xiamenense TaxID=1297121 RepID=UPI0035CF1444
MIASLTAVAFSYEAMGVGRVNKGQGLGISLPPVGPGCCGLHIRFGLPFVRMPLRIPKPMKKSLGSEKNQGVLLGQHGLNGGIFLGAGGGSSYIHLQNDFLQLQTLGGAESGSILTELLLRKVIKTLNT